MGQLTRNEFIRRFGKGGDPMPNEPGGQYINARAAADEQRDVTTRATGVPIGEGISAFFPALSPEAQAYRNQMGRSMVGEELRRRQADNAAYNNWRAQNPGAADIPTLMKVDGMLNAPESSSSMFVADPWNTGQGSPYPIGAIPSAAVSPSDGFFGATVPPTADRTFDQLFLPAGGASSARVMPHAENNIVSSNFVLPQRKADTGSTDGLRFANVFGSKEREANYVPMDRMKEFMDRIAPERSAGRQLINFIKVNPYGAGAIGAGTIAGIAGINAIATHND